MSLSNVYFLLQAEYTALTKVGFSISNHYRDTAYAIPFPPRWPPLLNRFFNNRYGTDKTNLLYLAKFHCSWSNHCSCWVIFLFSRRRCRQLGFTKDGVLNRPGPICINVAVRSFMVICQTVADRPGLYSNFSTFQYSGRPPYWRLGSLNACLHHPRSLFDGLCHCTNYDWNCSNRVFMICKFSHFASLSLKCLFMPFLTFFWGRIWLCKWGTINKTLSGTPLRGKTS